MRQNICFHILADQDWIGLMIFKNFAEQDWIGFNFFGSGLDSDRKFCQSAHLCYRVLLAKLVGEQYKEYVWLQAISTIWIVASHTNPMVCYSFTSHTAPINRYTRHTSHIHAQWIGAWPAKCKVCTTRHSYCLAFTLFTTQGDTHMQEMKFSKKVLSLTGTWLGGAMPRGGTFCGKKE